MMKNVFLIVLGGLFLTTSLNAQDTQYNSGSIYSYLGIGLPVDYTSPYAAGMGLQGVAISDYRLNSLANPATWGHTFYTNVNGGFSLRAFDSSDHTGSTTNTSLQITQFQFSLPLIRERLGTSFSLAPLTESRFQTGQEITIPADENNFGEPIDYAVLNSGTGGLNRLELGFGFRLTESISFGYAPSLIFGTLENGTHYQFGGQNGLRDVNFTEINSNYGFGHRFGLYLNRRNFIGNNDRASLGITFNLPVNLNSETHVETELGPSRVDLIPANEFGDRDIRLPMEGAVGLSYQFNQQWLVSTDVVYQNWEDYRGRNEEFFTDRFRVGIGSQYNAAWRTSPGGFFTRFNYRLGATYDTGNLSINETKIETYMISAGLGLPTRAGSIDVNFDFGIRGTETNDLISERIYGLRVSFSLSEVMFRQRRLD